MLPNLEYIMLNRLFLSVFICIFTIQPTTSYAGAVVPRANCEGSGDKGDNEDERPTPKDSSCGWPGYVAVAGVGTGLLVLVTNGQDGTRSKLSAIAASVAVIGGAGVLLWRYFQPIAHPKAQPRRVRFLPRDEIVIHPAPAQLSFAVNPRCQCASSSLFGCEIAKSALSPNSQAQLCNFWTLQADSECDLICASWQRAQSLLPKGYRLIRAVATDFAPQREAQTRYLADHPIQTAWILFHRPARIDEATRYALNGFPALTQVAALETIPMEAEIFTDEHPLMLVAFEVVAPMEQIQRARRGAPILLAHAAALAPLFFVWIANAPPASIIRGALKK